MARESRAVSQGLSVKAREPKLKSSGQEVRAELPSQDRVETREPKLGSKGQAGIRAGAQTKGKIKVSRLDNRTNIFELMTA